MSTPYELFRTDGEFHGLSVFRLLNPNYTGPLFQVRVVIPGNTTGGSKIDIYPSADGLVKHEDLVAIAGSNRISLVRIYDQVDVGVTGRDISFFNNGATSHASPFFDGTLAEPKTVGDQQFLPPEGEHIWGCLCNRYDVYNNVINYPSNDWGRSSVLPSVDASFNHFYGSPNSIAILEAGFFRLIPGTYDSPTNERAPFTGILDARVRNYTGGQAYYPNGSSPTVSLSRPEPYSVITNFIGSGASTFNRSQSWTEGAMVDDEQPSTAEDYYNLNPAFGTQYGGVFFLEHWCLLNETGPYSPTNIDEDGRKEIHDNQTEYLDYAQRGVGPGPTPPVPTTGQICGSALKVRIGFEGGWVWLEGERSSSNTIASETVDTTQKNNAGWRELDVNAPNMSTISFEGLVTDGSIQSYVNNRAIERMHVFVNFHDDVLYWSGEYKITNLQRQGSYNDMESISCTFESVGVITSSTTPPEPPPGSSPAPGDQVIAEDPNAGGWGHSVQMLLFDDYDGPLFRLRAIGANTSEYFGEIDIYPNAVPNEFGIRTPNFEDPAFIAFLNDPANNAPHWDDGNGVLLVLVLVYTQRSGPGVGYGSDLVHRGQLYSQGNTNGAPPFGYYQPLTQNRRLTFYSGRARGAVVQTFFDTGFNTTAHAELTMIGSTRRFNYGSTFPWNDTSYMLVSVDSQENPAITKDLDFGDGGYLAIINGRRHVNAGSSRWGGDRDYVSWRPYDLFGSYDDVNLWSVANFANRVFPGDANYIHFAIVVDKDDANPDTGRNWRNFIRRSDWSYLTGNGGYNAAVDGVIRLEESSRDTYGDIYYGNSEQYYSYMGTRVCFYSNRTGEYAPINILPGGPDYKLAQMFHPTDPTGFPMNAP